MKLHFCIFALLFWSVERSPYQLDIWAFPLSLVDCLDRIRTPSLIVERRLEEWKGKFLSRRQNYPPDCSSFSISALSYVILSIGMLGKSENQSDPQQTSLRGNINNHFYYHLVSWVQCVDQNGKINREFCTSIFDLALMDKCWQHTLSKPYDTLQELLTYKYGPKRGSWRSRPRNTTQTSVLCERSAHHCKHILVYSFFTQEGEGVSPSDIIGNSWQCSVSWKFLGVQHLR